MGTRFRFKLRTLFVVVLLAAVATPISIRVYRHYYPRPFFVGPTVCLCVTSGLDDISHAHIANLLSSHGINSVAEGSKVYEVVVEKRRFNDAVKLLEKSASDGLPTINLRRDEDGLLWVSGDESQKFNKRFDSNIDDMIGSKDRHADLVFAIKRNSQRCSELTKSRFKFVRSLSGWERKYMDQGGVMKSGYEVVLELANHPENADAICFEVFQITNDGREIDFLGGSTSQKLQE